ncbi:antibiotic biosynthesis monooxygenase [Brenneria goodwinii]|uniref:Antibiotic biosynthesis monooxygenase n=1 Tax=Brenneria goodwinii TaxID=1109412 RepID=A0A0G4JZC3_9GAMM|nr:putative quinol monooxygenase [Brenneria goodwinii]ATA23592.1 antibiotic biosynthesis monooxygenase [Brenneria goodwinii]MCG8154767.1 antibiotic biosynthesis monooxygenase [Brenneria goodwinii]MCG8159896.1 antibiotic biosynthesis monooxygenase [Brenneria goodwinii]MCG8164005.1 antibiotic biosynthesis monooxygenase [Brenneria goodwinii]MCG8168614.1 antibiotic biosynthesis monooxygenase [Brenneria goodwinii]
MEIRIVASLQAKAEFIDDVTAAVKQAVAPSRQEAGNLQYDLHEEIDKPGAFVFFERWKNQTVLTEHEQSAHFKRLIAELEGKTESSSIKLLKYLG